MAERLQRDWQVVALDLRGRGASETTPPGTYGWPSHARDALEAAQQLGAGRFNVVGWSMGAAVAMQAAQMDSTRLQRVVLIDAIGPVDANAMQLIWMAVDRLGTIYPSREVYLTLVKNLGTITPWSDYWQRYFEYELIPVEDGVTARTKREAVVEDMRYGEAHDASELWPGLTMPVLLVRARQPLLPSGGWIVSEALRERFMAAVASAELVEVDANHYGVGTHPDTADAIVRFLRPEL